MINDPNVQTDGFINLDGGMNSSWPLNTLPQSSCGLGLNVTFRGGKVMTRPGFRQLNMANGKENGYSYLEGHFQGAFLYFNHLVSAFDRIIIISSGHFLEIFLNDLLVNRLFPLLDSGVSDTTHILNPISEVYFCQVEKYLVVQNGIDTPLVYDGRVLFKSGQGPVGSVGKVSNIPVGKQMAYGQDRLFVALANGLEIVASDLNYSGSTFQIPINTSTQETNKQTKITTIGNHNFKNGDEVFIKNHTSIPDLNELTSIPIIVDNNDLDTFKISRLVESPGYGGYVTLKQSGRDYDALRFTETGILAEGGTYRMPTSFGRITALTFQAIGDTASGQGDLIVFCEKGAASFLVSNRDRRTWASTPGFQTILFPDIGCTSDKSIVKINSDLFWRSFDGIRSYSNARKDTFGSVGYVPISNEIRTILEKDSSDYFYRTSSAYFDNRLLITVNPRQDFRGTSNLQNKTEGYKPVTFRGLAVYDFASILASQGNRTAVWEGLWFAGDILQVLSTGFGPKERCFILTTMVRPEDPTNFVQLWEISKNDKFDTFASGNVGSIISVLETKSFPFRSEFELKQLSKADLWLHEIEGRSTISVYYRPDQYPCWVEWHKFLECADMKSCVNSKIYVEVLPGDPPEGTNGRYVQKLVVPQSAVQFFRLGYGPFSSNTDKNKVSGILTYGAPVNTTTVGPVTTLGVKNALESIKIDFSGGGEVVKEGDGTFLGGDHAYYIYTKTKYPDLAVYPTSDAVGSPDSVALDLLPQDLQPQFRTQIRLPAPLDPPDEKACDPITKRPFRNGHEFQFRIKWEGFLRINKFLAYAYPRLEQIGSDCP